MAFERGAEDAAGMWCADNSAICSSLYWCGPTGFAWSTLAGVTVFGVLFLTVMFLVYPLVEAKIEQYPSTIAEETGASWFAWHVQSVIHSVTVVCLVVGGVWMLSGAPPAAQFDAPSSHFTAYNGDIALIAIAAHIFFCFLLADTVITFARRAMTPDYFAHHVAFCSICVLVLYDCLAPYLAGWLLLMEVSTIFLNGFSFFRHRLGYGHWLVKVFFGVFALTFMVFRLFGTSYIAWSFSRVMLREQVDFAGVPRWHLKIVWAAMVGAWALQLFWAYAIGKKLVKVLVSGTSGATKKATSSEDEAGEEDHSAVSPSESMMEEREPIKTAGR